MTPSAPSLSESLIRIIQINARTIDSLGYGKLIFEIHQGRLVEVSVAETLRLSVGAQLGPLSLRSEETD